MCTATVATAAVGAVTVGVVAVSIVVVVVVVVVVCVYKLFVGVGVRVQSAKKKTTVFFLALLFLLELFCCYNPYWFGGTK